MYSRRDFGKLALAALPVPASAAKISSTFDGVMIGAQTYSFRDRSLDDCLKAMQDIGLGYAELWQGHVEPKGMKAPELKKWRETVSLDEFKQVAKKVKDAGIVLYAYNYSFRDDFSDKEIERGFEFAKALGVKCLTASSNVTTAKRVNPYAMKARMMVGMHNHSRIVKNEFATPEDFAAARAGMSKYIAVNLDIGHFFGAGFDPVKYLQENYDYIVTIHVKDKDKKDVNMPFGQGATPIKAVMQMLKAKKYKIPAMIEYEYKGQDTVAEVRKCFDFMKNCLK